MDSTNGDFANTRPADQLSWDDRRCYALGDVRVYVDVDAQRPAAAAALRKIADLIEEATDRTVDNEDPAARCVESPQRPVSALDREMQRLAAEARNAAGHDPAA